MVATRRAISQSDLDSHIPERLKGNESSWKSSFLLGFDIHRSPTFLKPFSCGVENLLKAITLSNHEIGSSFLISVLIAHNYEAKRDVILASLSPAMREKTDVSYMPSITTSSIVSLIQEAKAKCEPTGWIIVHLEAHGSEEVRQHFTQKCHSKLPTVSLFIMLASVRPCVLLGIPVDKRPTSGS